MGIARVIMGILSPFPQSQRYGYFGHARERERDRVGALQGIVSSLMTWAQGLAWHGEIGRQGGHSKVR